MHQDEVSCKGVGDAPPQTNVQAIFRTAAAMQKRVADKINPDGSLKPEVIRSLITLEGINLRALAETHGFTDPCIHQVINREYPGLRVRRLLAEALEMDYECIWGDDSDV